MTPDPNFLEVGNDRPRRRIIIVDDHPLFCCGLTSLINGELDMVVCAQAKSHHQALDLIAIDPPDLATVELSLGDHDGLNLIKDIRQRFPMLPVLVISMRDESFYAERAIRAGARGFISKRQMEGTMLNALRAVLSGAHYISPAVCSMFAENYLYGSLRQKNDPVASLSDRQLEVFRLIGVCISTRSIAQRLNLSVKTIETYREQIKSKLTLHNGTELVQTAAIWVETGVVRSGNLP